MSHDHNENPSVYSEKTTMPFDVKISKAELKTKAESFLLAITIELKDKGCTLIGHIKGQFDAGENGTLFFSVTDFNEVPRFKSDIKGSIIQVDLTINVIVYGVTEGLIENIFNNAFSDF